MAASYGEWEPVIGLEVHAQLLTRTKLFCPCETSFGDEPNRHVCPVCLGLPGALPTPNRAAIELAVMAAIALECSIEETSVFARKNYFYPDLPKGYQISQYEQPFSRHGKLRVEADHGPHEVRILRIHMEEDAGKNVHAGAYSVVDLNRAGTALIEIVSEPDLRSAAEASDYLRRLRDILMTVGANDGNLEQGSFRCDANVSVRKIGDPKLGTRSELKNINSFRFVEEAIDVEIRRQIGVLEAGGTLRQQTRGYASDKRETYLLRDKENDAGYRYFPDPDLPSLVIDELFVSRMRRRVPELPETRRARYTKDLGLTPYAAQVLTGHPRIAAYFDECLLLASGVAPELEPVKIANFIQAELFSAVTTTGLDATFPIKPAQLVELLDYVRAGTISGKQAKEVYAAMAGNERTAKSIIDERKLAVMSDSGELERIAADLVEKNPKQVAQYRAGKTQMLGFFVGQIMKATGGSANPALVNDILKRLLDVPS